MGGDDGRDGRWGRGAAICRHAQWNITHACLLLLNCQSYRCRGSRGCQCRSCRSCVQSMSKDACGQNNEIFILLLGRNRNVKRRAGIVCCGGAIVCCGGAGFAVKRGTILYDSSDLSMIDDAPIMIEFRRWRHRLLTPRRRLWWQ